MNSYSVDFNITKCLSLCKVSLKQPGLFTRLKCSPLLDQGGSSLLVSISKLEGTRVSVKYRNPSVQLFFFSQDCHTLLSFTAVLCTDLQSTRLPLLVHCEMMGAWRDIKQITSELTNIEKSFPLGPNNCYLLIANTTLEHLILLLSITRLTTNPEPFAGFVLLSTRMIESSVWTDRATH